MAENSYQGAVTKAKEAIGEITKEVNTLDKKLQSVVKTLQDYQKKGIPSKVTDQLKEQSSQIKALEDTIKSLTKKLEQKAQVEKNLASVTKKHTEETMKATLENAKHNSELKKSILSTMQTADAYQKLKNRQKEQIEQLKVLDAQGQKGTEAYKKLASSLELNSRVLNEIDAATKKLTATEKEETNVIKEKIPTLRQLAILGKEQQNALAGRTNGYDQLKNKQKLLLESLRNLTEAGRQNTSEFKFVEQAYTRTKNKVDEIDASIKKLTESEKQNGGAGQKVANAYNDLNNRLKQARDLLLAYTVQGRRAGESQKDFNQRILQARNNFQNLTNQANAAKKAVSNFGNTSLGGLVQSAKSLMSAFGVIGGVTLFATMVKDAFALIRTLDSISFSMKAVITDSRELGQTEMWLKDITEAFGAELVTTTNRYIKFRAAAQQAGFTAEETQGIFGTMTKAAGVLGLKTDELTGIYLALEQMISKGKITTEELRRQLGERLPGAMDIMAKSMGKTTAELDKMLKAGEVITKDVLPGFAEQVEIAFGLDSIDKVDTLQAATMRLKNAWTLLVEDFSKGNNTTSDLRKGINFLAENLGTILKTTAAVVGAFVLWKGSVLASALATNVLNGSLKVKILRLYLTEKAAWRATVATRGFTAAMLTNPLTIFVVALGALAVALWDTEEAFGASAKATIEDGEEKLKSVDSYNQVTTSVETMLDRYNTLNDIMGVNKDKTKLSTAEQIELEKIIAKIGLIMPGVVTEVNRYTKATELNTTAVEANIVARKGQTALDAAAALQAQEESLNDVTKAEEEFNEKLKKGGQVQIEIGEKTYRFYKRNGELISRVKKGSMWDDRKANDIETKIFHDRVAQMKDQKASLEELSFANKLLLFETKGLYEEETKAYREKKQQDDDEAKRLKDEFNNMSVKETMQKTIDDSEIKRNEALGLNAEEMSKLKIESEEAYVAKVKEAIDNVKNYSKEAYETAKKNLETAQKDYDDFFDKKADKKADNTEKQLEREEEKRLKARIKAEKDYQKAKFENAEASLKITVDANQAIMEDELQTGQKRFQSMQELADDMNILAYERKKFELKMAQLEFDEIDQSDIRSPEEKAKALEALNEKKLAIETNFQNELAEVQRQNRENFDSIASSEIQKYQEVSKNKEQITKQGYDEQIKKANDTYQEEVDNLNSMLDANLISREQYNDYVAILTQQREDTIQKIQRDSAIAQMEQQIELAKKLAESDLFKNNPQAQKALLDQIAQWEMDLSDMKTDHILNNMQLEKEQFERLQQFKAEYIKGASQAIGDLLNIDSANIEELFTKVSNGIGKNAEDILETAGIVGNILADVMGAVAEKNIERLEEQKDANNEYYDELLENEELSEQQKDAIQAERDKKNKQIDKRIKEEKVKAAKAEKANAVFQIGINTATAILGIWAQVPKWDFGISAGVLTGFVSALGALQMAAVLAKPIPKFELGTKYAAEGLALVDEKRPEVHTDRFGNVKSFGSNKPNLRYLERGDKIYPSHKRFFDSTNIDNIERFAWNMNAISNGDAITNEKMEMAMINTIMGMRGDMNSMGKRIERLASRPINNNVKVKIENDKPY